MALFLVFIIMRLLNVPSAQRRAPLTDCYMAATHDDDEADLLENIKGRSLRICLARWFVGLDII